MQSVSQFMTNESGIVGSADINISTTILYQTEFYFLYGTQTSKTYIYCAQQKATLSYCTISNANLTTGNYT
jgi:hypothetical protein